MKSSLTRHCFALDFLLIVFAMSVFEIGEGDEQPLQAVYKSNLMQIIP